MGKVKKQVKHIKQQVERKKENFDKFLPFLYILIPVIIALLLHSNSLFSPVTEDMAFQNVENEYKSVGMNNQIGSEQFNKEIKELSEQYKNLYQDENNNPYLTGVDSYLFLRQAEKALEGEKTSSFFVLSEVWLYKIGHLFNSNFTLSQSAYWLPVLFSLLSIILIFFIAKRLTNDIGGFFAALLLAVNPQFFSATLPGFADTNAMNLFLSLLCVFLLFETIAVKEWWKKSAFILGLLITLKIWSTAWNGYFYIVALIIIFSIIYAVYWVFQNRKKLSTKQIAGIIMIVMVLILIGGMLKNTSFVISKIDSVNRKVGGIEQHNLFPSTISSTSELFSVKETLENNKISQNPLIYLLNGWMMTILTLLSLSLLLIKFKKEKATPFEIFTIIWVISLFLVAYNSVRFFSFFALPFCVLISYGSYIIQQHISVFLKNKNIKKTMITPISVGIITILIILSTTTSAFGLHEKAVLSERAKRFPVMNDILWDTGQHIEKNSQENAIISTWWDTGYALEYASKRETVMDNGVGGSADPRIYWTSRALLSTDKNESLNILKMISCANNLGTIQNHNINLSIVECEPPEQFIVITTDMIKKTDLFRYYTEWTPESKKFTSPQIPSISDPITCYPNNEKTMLKCGEKTIVDLQQVAVTLGGQPFPGVLVSQKYFVKTLTKGEYSLLVYPEIVPGGNIYKAVIIRSDLIDTLMVRLYFMKGYGFEEFELFNEVSDPLLGRMAVYKVKEATE